MERLFAENCVGEVKLTFHRCVTKREEPINVEYGNYNLVFTTMGIDLGFMNIWEWLLFIKYTY